MGLPYLREVPDRKKLDLWCSGDSPVDTLYFGVDSVYRVLYIMGLSIFFSLDSIHSCSDDVLYHCHFLSHHNSIV